MKITCHLIIIFFTWLPVYKISAQDNWELKKNENGITVYSRGITNEKLKEIRVVCELPGTTAQLKEILQNVGGHARWVYLTKKTNLVKKVDDQTLIYYSASDMPWPVTDRDLVVELTITEAPDSGNLSIRAKSISDYLPPKKDYVRVPYSLATWEVVPLPNNKLKVDYTFRVNPGGDIPSWIVNAAATTGPYNTFVKLRDLLAAKQAR
ncbi:MAG: hypothetical protein JWQ14_3378 [Adhaeribacter sp.]|jgi:hypothetical protein|nr:hypothetical protein [Adhaeribacter sp.]